jgi:predicted amidohydrolase
LSTILLEPADHFCRLYDEVDVQQLLDHAEAWRADPATERTARWLRDEVLAGRYDARRTAGAIAAALDPGRQRIAHLRGLDLAFQEASPTLGARPPRALTAMVQRYTLLGRFNTEAVAGGLVPRFAAPGRRGQLPDALADLFGAVQRVSPACWESVDHIVFPMRSRFTAPERTAGALVGCAPMIADPDEMNWEAEERDGLRFYRIAVKATPAVRARIESLVESFDSDGVQIAVLPELVASRELLAAWQDLLRRRAIPPHSRLRWVLIGTGDIEPRGSRPVNAGAVLDARTGELLLQQRKQHPFNIKPGELRDWALPLPTDHQLDEDLRRGHRLVVAETGLGRLGILVCEDLARVAGLGATIRELGMSHALAPVFSKPTLEHYWEHSRAKVHADETGTSVIVSNSLVVGRLQGHSAPLGASLVHTPWGGVPQQAERPTDVMRYLLRDEEPVRRV